MVTWDSTWSFTLSVSQPKLPKASIYQVTVREYSSGNTYGVQNGGSIAVKEERVIITAYVKNIGQTDGTIYAELFVDGVSKGVKSVSAKVNVGYPISWQIELPAGTHTIKIQAGH